MEQEEIINKTIELIKKLKEKLPKCNWVKVDGFNGEYILSFPDIGQVELCRDMVTVLNCKRDIIMKYVSKTSDNPYNLPLEIAKLWGTISEIDRKKRDAHLDVLIKELDKLK